MTPEEQAHEQALEAYDQAHRSWGLASAARQTVETEARRGPSYWVGPHLIGSEQLPENVAKIRRLREAESLAWEKRQEAAERELIARQAARAAAARARLAALA